MKTAIIAWGSLVSDPRDLGVAGGFKPTGPVFPIEFCRVSRDGRLTLVIDEAVGKLCPTYVAISAFGDLDAAIEDLRLREGMPSAMGVGFVDLGSGKYSSRAVERHPQSVAAINAWAQANGCDAAIWTALASNFHEPGKAAEPFSVKAAIRYLETRDDPTLRTALHYIRKAPQEVRTPVRTAVAQRWPEG
jgi:hypothetical protein